MLRPTFGVSLSFYPAVQLLNFPRLKECLSNLMTPARQVCSSLEYKVVNLFFFFFLRWLILSVKLTWPRGAQMFDQMLFCVCL